MERVIDAKNRNYIDSGYVSLLLLLVCLVFLAVGNFLYHRHILPITENLELQLNRFVSPGEREYISLLPFLTDVILVAKRDIACLLLIAFSRLTRIPRLFTMGILAHRSAVFGFCGAFIIVNLWRFSTRLCGVLVWFSFFVYHVTYFSILLCFSEATLRSCGTRLSLREMAQYTASILVECSLIILLNSVYYFLIYKIKS